MKCFVQNIMTWYFQVHAGTPRLPPACPSLNPAQLADSLGDSEESVPAILEKAWTTREVKRHPYHTSHLPRLISLNYVARPRSHHVPTLDFYCMPD